MQAKITLHSAFHVRDEKSAIECLSYSCHRDWDGARLVENWLYRFCRLHMRKRVHIFWFLTHQELTGHRYDVFNFQGGNKPAVPPPSDTHTRYISDGSGI